MNELSETRATDLHITTKVPFTLLLEGLSYYWDADKETKYTLVGNTRLISIVPTPPDDYRYFIKLYNSYEYAEFETGTGLKYALITICGLKNERILMVRRFDKSTFLSDTLITRGNIKQVKSEYIQRLNSYVLFYDIR